MLLPRRARTQNAAGVRDTASNVSDAPRDPGPARAMAPPPAAATAPLPAAAAARDSPAAAAARASPAATAAREDALARDKARRDGLSLGLAVGFSGIAFGAAAVTAGLSAPQACVLSLLAFTGASQYALAAAVAGGGSLVAGTFGALLLGSRNALYGLRLADVLQVRGGRRLLTAHAVIDETTAMALAQPGRAAARTGFAATFGALYAVWNAATLAGALGAGRLGSPAEFGVDVIGPAAFLALLWPRLSAGPAERRVAAAGAAVAIAGTPFLPPGIPVMLAAVAVAAGVRR
jgi:predicted branched-subunit amino acid permease